MQKLHIKKGDTVFVKAGDYKGKKGRVLEVFPKKNRAIVEGINLISKHAKSNSVKPEGGIVKKEAPVHLSNLMLICPETGQSTRIGRIKNSEGKLVRYSKKSKNKEEIK